MEKMSGVTDAELPVVYVRWEADTSIGTSYTVSQPFPISCKFRFLKFEMRLQFYCTHNPFTSKYEYFLTILVPPINVSSSFVASVHVEDRETGRVQPQLSQERHIPSIHTSNTTIWTMALTDSELAVRNSQNNHKLRFLVVLKKDLDVLTAIADKETETECHLLEAVGQASCSTTSKSVQTTLLHSVSPCLESLSEDLAQLMVQDSDPDMVFLCRGHSTRAHRSIVCSRSPVIARMMASDMVDGRTGVVTIPNMEQEVFKTFLGYLYSGKLEELTFDDALALYEIGGQYAVPSLVKKCLQYLMEHLSVENACEILAIADVNGDSKFAENVIEYILENKVPLLSDRWPGFCDDNPKLANKVLSHFYKMSMNIGKN